MLMLSGIQHYVFCPRQWALIHIEQVWADNRLTVEGQLLHERADNPFYRQKNGACVSLRSVAISSRQLGLYGFTDVVELQPSEVADNCIKHPSYPGYWKPYPVEYKHGHAKPDERDEMVLNTYDVETIMPSGSKRLRHVAKECQNYGQRVQNSVFECVLTPAQFARLKGNIMSIIDEQKDSVRFYFMGNHWNHKVETIGKETSYNVEAELII